VSDRYCTQYWARIGHATSRCSIASRVAVGPEPSTSPELANAAEDVGDEPRRNEALPPSASLALPCSQANSMVTDSFVADHPSAYPPRDLQRLASVKNQTRAAVGINLKFAFEDNTP